VFDLGCGCGRQTLALARELSTKIVAVDTYQGYLDELQQAARDAGLGARIETRCCSMDQLAEPEDSVDLIWSEGAAYSIGVPKALEAWRRLLKPDGLLAFTELTWLGDDPPQAARDYWQKAYPAMMTAASNRELVGQAGYERIDDFPLPPEDWWAYYRPLQTAMDKLRPRAEESAELPQVIRETEEEIEMYERFSAHVGYTFFVLKRR
jgi:serine/threonine-protein kinase HipA